MKEIKLTQNRYAIVDDEDFMELCKYKWYFNGRYAARGKYSNGKSKKIFMHRVILKTTNGKESDHINGDGLDNTRKNLRVCTRSQNLRNQNKSFSSKSGFKGVCFNKERGKWHARIWITGKNKHLGYFTEKTEAALSYNVAARDCFGEFASFNNI